MRKNRPFLSQAIAATGLTIVSTGFLLAAPSLRGAAQAPAGAQKPASNVPTANYIVSGNLSDADLERLLAAMRKNPNIEQVEIQKVAGFTLLRVRSITQGTLIITTARNAGFTVRSMPVRVYLATGASDPAEMAKLRETLANLPGVEQVDVSKQPEGIALRVRGALEPAALSDAAKPIGYYLQMVSFYVAAGSAKEADLAKLRDALSKLPGAARVEMRGLIGGANLLVYGDVKDAALAKAATDAGYSMLPVSDPAGDTRRFSVAGVNSPEDEEKLRNALRGVGGIGELQIRNTAEGMRLGITNGAAANTLVVAAAKTAGFDLTPMEMVTIPSLESDKERNTPPAPNERTVEEAVKVGDLAPDFNLVTKDGKEHIRLSDSFGKRPVVLIFGSYT